jgi:hypothetical protein
MTDDVRAELVDEALAVLSEAVLKLGPILEEAYSRAADFEHWVVDHLPLQFHTAERIRAMYHLHEFRPSHPELPEPWKALWDLD